MSVYNHILLLLLISGLQCIQDVLPDLGLLLDSMKDLGPSQPSAVQALVRYENICSVLSTEDLKRTVETTCWYNGMKLTTLLYSYIIK